MDTLTALSCPPEKKALRVYDTRVQGLALRVRPTGTKTYLYYRRLPDKSESPRKICEITLGNFQDITLEQARLKATELNLIIGLGKDPTKEAAEQITYGKLFERWINDYAKIHTVTWAEVEKNHRRHFGMWDKRIVTTIKREHVQTWFNNLGNTKGKDAANRNYNTFRAVFSWGLMQGIITGDNPCIGIKTFRKVVRERFILPGEEMQKFVESLNQEEPVIRDFFWMCLLTGARCSNVMGMQWSQINMDLQWWRIPVTKNGDSQTIPLTSHALEILRLRKESNDLHPVWVFPSNRKGWKTHKTGHLVSLRHAFQRVIKRAGLSDLRIHDLRRTAGSYMAIQGVSLTIIGKALGHRSPQATLIYARLTQDPVRQALENAQAALVLPNNLVHIPQTQKSDGNANGAELVETS